MDRRRSEAVLRNCTYLCQVLNFDHSAQRLGFFFEKIVRLSVVGETHCSAVGHEGMVLVPGEAFPQRSVGFFDLDARIAVFALASGARVGGAFFRWRRATPVRFLKRQFFLIWFLRRQLAAGQSLNFASFRGDWGERCGDSLSGRESNTQPFNWEADIPLLTYRHSTPIRDVKLRFACRARDR